MAPYPLLTGGRRFLRPVPENIRQTSPAGSTGRRRRPAPAARVRGFTLVETAISGIVIAGITASLLMALRYSQMVGQGKAVGEQMTTISEGADRYMKQYGPQILALDPRCAEPTLQLDEGTAPPSPPSGTAPSCSLVLGDVTVANGFQPSVDELQRLQLVRATDALLLPFSPGVAQDKRSGQSAIARIAVWIRPVRTTGTPSGAASGLGNAGGGPGGNWSGDGDGGATAQLLQTAQAQTGGSGGHTIDFNNESRNGLNMPPTLFGVNCYNGKHQNASTYVGGTSVFADAKDHRKVLPIYTEEEIRAARAPGGVLDKGLAVAFFSGEHYCRHMQRDFGEGIFSASGTTPGGGGGGGGGTGTQAWTLEAITFNTQPYYYGIPSLPLGAAVQLGAALTETGFSGRLSTLRGSPVESRTMHGLQGQSSTDNPILSQDGLRGVPGILAVVRLMADSSAAGTGTGTGTGNGGTSSLTWDATGNSLYNVSLLQGQQIAGATAVVGTESSLSTKGRSAVLAVNGNMVMGADSTIMANQVEAHTLAAQSMTTDQLTASALEVTGSSLRLGQRYAATPFNLFMRKGTQVRLPRVDPGSKCEPYSDVAMSRAVIIRPLSFDATLAMTRFLLYCKPDPAAQPDLLTFGTSYWTSPEYEALLAKYPKKNFRWYYFDSAPGDSDDSVYEP